MLYANFMALCYTELELPVLPIKVLHVGIGICWPFCYWPWPWPYDHIQTWPISPGDTPDVWKWSSCIKASKADIYTNRHINALKVICHSTWLMVVICSCAIETFETFLSRHSVCSTALFQKLIIKHCMGLNFCFTCDVCLICMSYMCRKILKY